MEAECHHDCLNVNRGEKTFTCTCRAGYTLANDEQSCIKIDVPNPIIVMDETLKGAKFNIDFPADQVNNTQYIKTIQLVVNGQDFFNYPFWTDSTQPREILDLPPNAPFNVSVHFLDDKKFNLLNPITMQGHTRNPQLNLEASRITHDSVELKWHSNYDDLSRNTDKLIEWSLFENGNHQGQTTINSDAAFRDQKTITDLRPATPYNIKLSETIEGEEISVGVVNHFVLFSTSISININPEKSNHNGDYFETATGHSCSWIT